MSEIYFKTKSVINSCHTDQQLNVAKRFLTLSKPHLTQDEYMRLLTFVSYKQARFKFDSGCWATRELVAVV